MTWLIYVPHNIPKLLEALDEPFKGKPAFRVSYQVRQKSSLYSHRGYVDEFWILYNV